MDSTVLLTNVKVSVKCEPISLHTVAETAQRHAYAVKARNNFIVLKKGFCCSLFKTKIGGSHNHVNITKIKSLSHIEKILEKLKRIKIICLPETLVVDNITGQLNIGTAVNLRKLITSNLQCALDKQAKDSLIHVKYNNETFPGAFFRIYQHNRKLGTSIVFHSGNIVFVGCKNMEQLQCLALLTRAIILSKF